MECIIQWFLCWFSVPIIRKSFMEVNYLFAGAAVAGAGSNHMVVVV